MNADDSRFLVLGLTGIVLRDLIGMMNEGFPSLEATAVKSEVDAVAKVSQEDGWQFAFLNLSPDDFIASELSKLFDALGTKVVLLGDAAEDAVVTSAYPILMRPFIATDIFRLLGTKS